MSDAYAKAGVNIDAGNEAVDRIKGRVKSTHGPAVLTGIGSFGALYDIKSVLKDYDEPVLVQSIDGVGTKLIVADMMKDWRSSGKDIVNHSTNDILAMGAKPLTFLDYVAHEKLLPEVMEEMIIGMTDACKESDIALIGGETAEMPGVYLPGQHDIAGCITGVVERSKIITGEKIRVGDTILGLASNGLHTNGYSLARRIIFELAKLDINSTLPTLSETIGQALIKPHLSYSKPVLSILDQGIEIRGIAHITGGGFVHNIPRVLPVTCDAVVKKGSWPITPIFTAMQNLGEISEEEMYTVFNMGIGMILVISPDETEKISDILKKSGVNNYKIGEIVAGTGKIKLT